MTKFVILFATSNILRLSRIQKNAYHKAFWSFSMPCWRRFQVSTARYFLLLCVLWNSFCSPGRLFLAKRCSHVFSANISVKSFHRMFKNLVDPSPGHSRSELFYPSPFIQEYIHFWLIQVVSYTCILICEVFQQESMNVAWSPGGFFQSTVPLLFHKMFFGYLFDFYFFQLLPFTPCNHSLSSKVVDNNTGMVKPEFSSLFRILWDSFLILTF